MTHIASHKTKKAFKEAVTLSQERDETGQAKGRPVYLDDPSIFNPVSGSVFEIMQKVHHITVTNHPKRSWFASITRKADGSFKVG
jgi:hypothetical protein